MSEESRFLFDSKFDDRIGILIVYPEDPQYSEISGMFEERGHAFIYHEGKLIVIDGAAVSQDWFTADHLDVIHAHELAHYYAGHTGGNNEEERQADWIGIQVLESFYHKGKVNQTAVKLHRDEFRERYGEEADGLDQYYQDMFASNNEISQFFDRNVKTESSRFIVRQWKNSLF